MLPPLELPAPPAPPPRRPSYVDAMAAALQKRPSFGDGGGAGGEEGGTPPELPSASFNMVWQKRPSGQGWGMGAELGAEELLVAEAEPWGGAPPRLSLADFEGHVADATPAPRRLPPSDGASARAVAPPATPGPPAPLRGPWVPLLAATSLPAGAQPPSVPRIPRRKATMYAGYLPSLAAAHPRSPAPSLPAACSCTTTATSSLIFRTSAAVPTASDRLDSNGDGRADILLIDSTGDGVPDRAVSSVAVDTTGDVRRSAALAPQRSRASADLWLTRAGPLHRDRAAPMRSSPTPMATGGATAWCSTRRATASRVGRPGARTQSRLARQMALRAAATICGGSSDRRPAPGRD